MRKKPTIAFITFVAASLGAGACSDDTPDGGDGGGSGGNAGVSGAATGGAAGTATGGASGFGASGGAAGAAGALSTGGASGTAGGAAGAGMSGGVSGSAGQGGAAATAGMAGAADSGGVAGSATGGAGTAGTSGAGGAGAGTNGGAAGKGGAGTGGGGAGGAGAGGKGGGAGAGGSTGDRCDLGVYDPGTPPQSRAITNGENVHDPTMVLNAGTYTVFNTGLWTRTSTNMTSWGSIARVLSPNPSWTASSVPGVTDLWAPDISNFGGAYHLYYAASTFNSNRSCIGHATRTSLTSGTWADSGGPVFCSNVTSSVNWNAIESQRRSRRVGQSLARFRQRLGRYPHRAPHEHGRPRHLERVHAHRDAHGRRHRERRDATPVRLLLPLHVVGSLLPGSEQHVQHPRRPLHEHDGRLR